MEPRPQRRPDELLLDELTDQLDRTRRLLLGDAESAASRALAEVGGQREVEARIAAELAADAPLAEPDRFLDAHRLVIRALEVLDQEGWRDPPVPRLGPLTPLAGAAVEFIAEYVARSYADSVVRRLRSLYARREARCEPHTPQRTALARARLEIERIAPGFGGGTAVPALVAGGAAIPALGWLGQRLGAADFTDRRVQLLGVLVLFVLFVAGAWTLLRGAGVAHRRGMLILQQPLAALWQTVGHCGTPPEDTSDQIALLAVSLTAAAWFVLPALAALSFLL